MLESDLIQITQRALIVTLKISAPILLLSMGVGLLVSILQTTTSIQEQTLTFVPKLLIIFLTLAFFFSYMVHTIVDYTRDIYNIIVLF